MTRLISIVHHSKGKKVMAKKRLAQGKYTMKILLLVAEFPPKMHGGMANYSYNIAKRLAGKNDVKVMSLPEYSVNRNYVSNLRFVYEAAGELRKARKERRKVVVYAISFRPEFSLISLYAKKMGIPVVFNGAGVDIYTNHPAFVLTRRIACKISSQIICGANFQKQILYENGAPPAKVHAILGGVDTQRFKPSLEDRHAFRSDLGLEDKFVLLSVGRLVKRKGFDNAIESLAHLRDMEDVALLIVGDGPQRAGLKDLAKNLGVEDRTKFLGFVSVDMLPRIYNAADLLVAPFKSDGRDMEGFPLVVQEAQASGLPVISTASAGLPELVGNNSSGFLVAEDSTRSVAKKIRELHGNKEMLKEMSENARERAVTLFDWAIAARKIETLLRMAYNSP